MSLDTCDNLVISCIDFRIQDLVHSWLHRKFPHEMYDYVAVAGSVKKLLAVEKQLEISERLHQVKHVILIEHEDCGAYETEEDIKTKQIQDLYKAKKEILRLFPALIIHLYYLHISGVFEEIQ